MKSIKEKAEAYDKVLEWATEAHKVCDGMLKEDLEHLFPELKDSEDERIRKDIIVLVKDWWDIVNKDNISTKEQMLAWLEKQCEHANFRNKIQVGDKVTRNEDGVLVNLSQLKRVAKKDEKQGEQKPWSEEDEKVIESILNHYKCMDKEWVNWLKSLKDRIQPQPKQEWGEEDENIYHSIIDILTKQGFQTQVNWLKPLKDRVQPQREWSEEDEAMYQGVIETEQYMLEVVNGRKIFDVGNEEY